MLFFFFANFGKKEHVLSCFIMRRNKIFLCHLIYMRISTSLQHYRGHDRGTKNSSLFCHGVKKQLYTYSLLCIFYIRRKIPSVTLTAVYIPCFIFSIFKQIVKLTCQQHNTAQIEMKLRCLNQLNIKESVQKQNSIAIPSSLR